MYCNLRCLIVVHAIHYQEGDMANSTDVSQRLAGLFDKQPCWTIAPLAKRMDYSIPSVRRFLSHCGYYSSFTHNGSWYTLASIPRFGVDRLWFHHDIGFSRAGSLTRTLVDLTTRSPAGMSAEKLGEKLRCRCHAVLVNLYRQGQLRRQRFGRAYVYLAADPSIADKQCQTLQPPPAKLPAEISVLILAQFIRSPNIDLQALAKAVSKSSGLSIRSEQIETLFAEHGIKKTA